jgi:MFS family permease
MGVCCKNKPTILLLLPAYLFYCIIMFGNMVLQQELTRLKVCRDISIQRNDTRITLNCTSIKSVSGTTAEWLGTSDSVMGIVSALTAGSLGGLSDSSSCGRRPVMLLALIGQLGYQSVMLVVALFDLGPQYIVIASAINGLTGGFAVYLAMVFAYAADITTPSNESNNNIPRTLMDDESSGSNGDVNESYNFSETKGRSSSFGLVESMLYVGNIVGPLIASNFARGESMSLLIEGLMFEGAIIVVLFLYILCIMPESLNFKKIQKYNKAKADYREDDIRSALLSNDTAIISTNTATTTTTTTATTTKHKTDFRRNNLFSALSFLYIHANNRRRILSFIFMFNFLILISFLRVAFVYTGVRYHWSSSDFDQYSSLGRGLPLAIGSWMLAGIFGHGARWYVQVRLLFIGSIGVVLYNIGSAISYNGTLFFIMGSFNVVGGIFMPLLRSSLSETASETDQGLLLTGIAAIETISGIWAPLIFSYIYSKTETINPSISMYIFASVGMLNVFLSGYLCVHKERTSTDNSSNNRDEVLGSVVENM